VSGRSDIPSNSSVHRPFSAPADGKLRSGSTFLHPDQGYSAVGREIRTTSGSTQACPCRQRAASRRRSSWRTLCFRQRVRYRRSDVSDGARGWPHVARGWIRRGSLCLGPSLRRWGSPAGSGFSGRRSAGRNEADLFLTLASSKGLRASESGQRVRRLLK